MHRIPGGIPCSLVPVFDKQDARGTADAHQIQPLRSEGIGGEIVNQLGRRITWPLPTVEREFLPEILPLERTPVGRTRQHLVTTGGVGPKLRAPFDAPDPQAAEVQLVRTQHARRLRGPTGLGQQGTRVGITQMSVHFRSRKKPQGPEAGRVTGLFVPPGTGVQVGGAKPGLASST